MIARRPKASPHGGVITEGTISHGTLRSQDLLRAFSDELERLTPFSNTTLISDARSAADNLDAYETGDEMSEPSDTIADDASEIVMELINELNHVVNPFGFYFGNTEGDGSDFGVWLIEPEDDEDY